MTVATASDLDFRRVFELQKASQHRIGAASAGERRAKIQKIKRAIELDFRAEIEEACRLDFGKPKAEVGLSEIYPPVSEAKEALANLSRWMQRQPVGTPLALLGGRSWIQHEPKGVCLIVSPWNFPFNLTFGPLISAIAAGNAAIVKPSERTPHSAAVMKKMIRSLFSEDEVALFEGGPEVAQGLLELPFDHIFFTGAPSIGKIVMAAAAKNLTSVTLELGGKSPVIVDETADIEKAAKFITWGKMVNAGQICIAPDYVLVHQSRRAAFVSALKSRLESYYGQRPAESQSFCKMVTEAHFDRVKEWLDEAVARGATVVHGGQADRARKSLAPTLVEGAPLDCALMQNEIFGPVLPIFSYKTTEEAIAFVQNFEKPLAFYIYSKSRRNIDALVKNTRAGGTCINSNDIHFYNNKLPFGGVNHSGIGKGHGRFGFEAFSNARGFYEQVAPGPLELLMPPYNGWKQRIIDLTIKWF